MLQFVELESKRDDDRLLADLETARLAVRGALQALVEVWSKQQELHKLTSAKGAPDQRIAALRKTLPAQSDDDRKTVRRHDSLAEYDGRRSQASTQVAVVMDDLTELWRTSQ